MSALGEPTATGSITIKAPASKVYELVSNPDKIVEFAEETFKIFPVGGRRWVGFNRNGWHVWPTMTKIIEAELGRVFTFEVGEFGIPVARWQYAIEEVEGGVRVTESTWDRRAKWFAKTTVPFTGVADRTAANTANIQKTLIHLKSVAEA